MVAFLEHATSHTIHFNRSFIMPKHNNSLLESILPGKRWRTAKAFEVYIAFDSGDGFYPMFESATEGFSYPVSAVRRVIKITDPSALRGAIVAPSSGEYSITQIDPP